MNRAFITSLFLLTSLLLAGLFLLYTTYKQGVNTTSFKQINNSPTNKIIKSPTQFADSNLASTPAPINTSSAAKDKGISIASASYFNKQLGFSFPHPSSWYKNGQDAEVINRNGIKTEVDINFADSASQTSLSVIYHLPPGGIEFYDDIAKQYRSGSGRFVSGGSQLRIAGKNAFQSVATVTRDGKGHLLNPPFKLIFVVLPDYEQAGAIELQFKTLDLNSKVQMELFSQLLSGFMFIHK
jgi:hypothetical protein